MTAVTHTTTAAPLAALLPPRRGKAWTVGTAPYSIRNAATSRITDGRRALIVVEEGNRTELYADRPDLFPVTPDAVVDSTDPASVAALAARALRWILPNLDADIIRSAAERGWHEVLRHKGYDLTELGFHLVDHGANPQMIERPDGPGMTWIAASGAEWGVWAHGVGPNFTLTYAGPLSGLYSALPVLLPPLDGHVTTDAGSGFTRYLTARFPQLRPVTTDEVEFGGHQDLHGWITLRSRAGLGASTHDDTQVCANVGPVGVDFLITAAAHLI